MVSSGAANLAPSTRIKLTLKNQAMGRGGELCAVSMTTWLFTVFLDQYDNIKFLPIYHPNKQQMSHLT